MSRNSRKTITQGMEELARADETGEGWSTGLMSDVDRSEARERESDFGEDDGSHGYRPTINLALRRTALSTILLSLLPLPAAGYPQPRSNTVRRDRRRSSSPRSSRGLERRLSERSDDYKRQEEKEGRIQVGKSRNRDVHTSSANKLAAVTVESSEQSMEPSPTTVFHRRADTAAASAKTTSFPIEVPITALPYKLTRGDDQVWTTVDDGWTLYGRASVESTHHALADTDNNTSDNATTSAFNITAALPAGWGQDSERGDLYAVPLIVVASVCMALLFMAFVVVVVISRVKAKRKAERKKRRQEVREKRERREKRLAARAVRTATVDPVRSSGDERRGSAATRSTQSRTRRTREDGFDSASSMTDSEHEDADSSRRPSGSGTTSTTVRLAKQRALVAAVEESVMTPSRAGRAKKRFGWTSAVNMTGPGNTGPAGAARLGDPRRVWGWKKGLRRRRAGGREEEQEETRSRPRSRSRSERTDGNPDTARAADQSTTGQQAVSPGTSPVAETLPSTLRTSALQAAEDAGEDQPGITDSQTADSLPASSTPNQEASERPQASAFPPAYYRAPTADAGPSLPNDDDVTNGRVTEAGPSARAMEKRPMAGVGYDDYFPAPTTEEQEEAVNIAYNRNGASAPLSGDTSIGPESHLADGESSAAIMPVPTGAGGHVATDDKQVLERLRLAGSAPPVAGAPAIPDVHQESSTEGQQRLGLQASAPELQVDEDGFERLEELLPPSEEEQNTSATEASAASSSCILPLPPAAIAQRSLAYARPSSPPRMSSPVIASAPSAPHFGDDMAGEDAQPSAPPLDIDAFDDEEQPTQLPPEPSAPGADLPPDERRLTEEGEEGTLLRRFTVPHRTLGIDLPSELAAPPAFPHPEDVASTSGATTSTLANVGAPRYLPRYEP